MHRFEILLLDEVGKTHVLSVPANTLTAARVLARLSLKSKPAVVLTVISEHLT